MGGSDQGTTLFTYIMLVAGWVLAAATLAWKVVTDRRDNARLRLTGRVIGTSAPARTSTGGVRGGYRISGYVANIGKRLITIEGVYADGGYDLPEHNNKPTPVELEPGSKPTPFEIGFGSTYVAREALSLIHSVNAIYALDADDKKRKMGRKDFNKFKSQAVRYLKEKVREDDKG